MKKRQREWSYKAGERGVNRVRVFEHWKSGKIFVEYRENGEKHRHALHTRNRDTAKKLADETAAQFRQTECVSVIPPRNGTTTATPDINVEPYVKRWLLSLNGNLATDTIDHYGHHLRTLIPEQKHFPISRLRPAVIIPWLDAQQGSSGTKRKYYYAASKFCQYLVSLEVLPANPMQNVKPPRSGKARVSWLENTDVIRLVEAQEEPYRTLSALIHGTGMEVSVTVGLKRRDIERTTAGYAIIAAGTKTESRHRRVHVDPWAVPYLERHIATLLPEAELFPGMNRYTPSDKHREACKTLGIENYRLQDSRHTWAVRAARAGASPEVMRRQLGHADTTMVNKVYAVFRPNEEEMTQWHDRAEQRDRTLHNGHTLDTPARG